MATCEDHAPTAHSSRITSPVCLVRAAAAVEVVSTSVEVYQAAVEAAEAEEALETQLDPLWSDAESIASTLDLIWTREMTFSRTVW